MSLMTKFRRRALALAFACAAFAPAAQAHASVNQTSIIEDERLMLDPATQASALTEAASLGADVVRANVIWRNFAPNANSTRKPKHFDGKNPDAYPAGVWNSLDGLVSGAQARGLQPLLTLTGPGPAWASRCKGSVKARQICKPDPKLFGAFVRAVGKRYQSVTMWSIWNEPNQGAWLSPQYAVSGHSAALTSAPLYRSLALSAIAGLRGTGHRGQTILLGETAPLGDDPSGCSTERGVTVSRGCVKKILKTSPQTFLQGVFCVDSHGHRLTGSKSSVEHCGHYKKLNVTGYAHHPYTRGGSRPPLSKVNPGEITIADASRLTKLLDAAARAKRIPAHLPVYYTEQGWQTNPPDNLFGVTPDQQAEYINQSDWIAYNNSRVLSVAQYLLQDTPPQPAFQTALRFPNGSPKPAYAAYQLPIWVVSKGANVLVYGQVRPAPNGSAQTVTIQAAAGPGSPYTDVQSVAVTSPNGTFTATAPASAGSVWRLVWGNLVSRQAQAAPK
jgi:hypothetical protein